MSVLDDEKSVQDSQPVDLIDLTCGAVHWRYNSSPLTVSYDGHDYAAQAGLAVGAIEETGNYLRRAWEIEVAWSCPFVKQYPATPPDAIVAVEIYRRQAGGDVEPWQSGYVASIPRRGQKGPRLATLKCLASYTALGVGSLCLRCGRTCQVPLYSPECGVDIEDWLIDDGVVDSVNGAAVTSATFALYDDQYFRGGPITINGYQRMVLDHQGDTVIMTEVIPGAAAEQAFTVAPGCDHTLLGDCHTLYENELNYRGAPNRPQGKNPYVQGVY
jgi:hypothetical protein